MIGREVFNTLSRFFLIRLTMIFKIITMVLLVALVYCLFLIFKKEKSRKKYNIIIEEANRELEKHKENLISELTSLGEKVKKEKELLFFVSQSIEEKNELSDKMMADIESHLQKQKELSQQAYENYCEILMQSYETEEKNYSDKIESLKENVSLIKEETDKEIQSVTEELNKIKETRAAAIQAQLREKEIKEKLSFYCLKVSDADLQDIKALERVKGQLNKPRILSMLIWKTYWQKQMTDLCNNVLGTNAVTGIYKITNQNTDECYIGQAANMADRWKQHAKCGLGIDTPAGNKLYRAMQEEGIQNFSWELLEECPRELLNEKEKFYIELYDSQHYGYNTISAPIRKKED